MYALVDFIRMGLLELCGSRVERDVNRVDKSSPGF